MRSYISILLFVAFALIGAHQNWNNCHWTVTSATTNHPELPAPKWISSTSTNNSVTFTHFASNDTVNNTFLITIPNP